MRINLLTKELINKEKEFFEKLKNKREMLIHFSKSIKFVHMGKYAMAEKELRKGENIGDFDELIVQQEYIEAKALLYLVKNNKLLPYSKKYPAEAYVLGMFDLIGEIKREMYDYLRKNNLKKAKQYFSFMLEIYDAFLELNFPNSLIPEFRRKQDIARIQIEQANFLITQAFLK